MGICTYCNGKIPDTSQGKRYCSSKCYHKSRIGRKRPLHGARVSRALKGRPLNEERKRKIGEANRKAIPKAIQR